MDYDNVKKKYDSIYKAKVDNECQPQVNYDAYLTETQAALRAKTPSPLEETNKNLKGGKKADKGKAKKKLM